MSIINELNKPHGWRLIPLGRLATRTQIRDRPDLEPLSVFLNEGVVPRSCRGDNHNRLGEDLSRYLVVMPGDIVFNKLRTWQGGLGVSSFTGIVSPAYYVCRPRDDINPQFLHYLLRSSVYLQELTRVSKWMPPSQFDISWDQLRQLPILLPGVTLQNEIADYLDTKTIRIDALVYKKRCLMKLLEQRLTSLAEEVTVGPVGGLKTGIPTIPEVPSSWRVLRNKKFMREVNRRSPDGSGELLSVSHITGVTPRSEKTVYMFEAESTVGYKIVQPGDLVINTMWAWMGAAGTARTVGIVSPAYGVYTIDKSVMVPEFFDILVRTPAYVTEMTRFSKGVTSSRLRLYPEEFLALRSPVPPVKEQLEIVERYRSESATTRATCGRLVKQISLLEERRQVLIAEAVTGQMEIPESAG